MLVWSDVPVQHLGRSGAADCVRYQSAVGALERFVSFDDELRHTGADCLLSECAEGKWPSFLVRALLDDPHGHAYLESAHAQTSAQRGHTYQKLLCIAFDLALLRTHVDAGFPNFAYHDGVFESLDKRKKTNLVEVLRENVEAGLQQIITLIDTDLPPSVDGAPVFDESEIVLRLHDEGEEGRLFRMASW